MFGGKKFDVEHAFNMYAHRYVTMVASDIYNNETVEQFKSVLDECHIYIVGLLPKAILIDVNGSDNELTTFYRIADTLHTLVWPMPPGSELIESVNGWAVETVDGKRYFPTEDAILNRLRAEHGALTFQVLYVGQAYGEDGSRNALDRLRKHETVQKIAVTGIPHGYDLVILFIEVVPDNRIITIFNPAASEHDENGDRIRAGIDKLHGTSEAERISLYEASLIRYFQPRFNKEFKESFPSTNLKVLSDCYHKDFCAVIAEISLDGPPFKMASDHVLEAYDHIASFDLHNEDSRKSFFALADV